MMMMNVEQAVEWELTGESDLLGAALTQCYFVHHKSHMTLDQIQAGAVGSQRLSTWAMA
jgi:hypothetical protein